MITLCYYVDEQDSEKNKSAAHRGVSQTQNNITWQRFKAVLNGSIDRAENRGFCMVNGRMATYEQSKLGLDGIHTEPIEFHMT